MENKSGEAKVQKVKNWSPVWIFPIVTVLIGAWILFYHYSHQGPEVTLITTNAEGIEGGKTRIKSRSVDVGVVESAILTDDLKHVEIKARLNSGMQKLLHKDSVFWVVKPQVGREGISGLGTLLSGAYIELQPGKEGSVAPQYPLLDSPPLASPDAKGIRVLLESSKAGQLSPGDPVLFRGYRVGSVETSTFDTQKRRITYQLFINAPNDRLVTTNVRFWKDSGIAVDLTSAGMRVEMGSLSTLFGGGVSFDIPEGLDLGEPVANKTEYHLFDDQKSIQDSVFTQHIDYVLFFKDSVRGLQPGAPVEFRGIRLGTVGKVPFFIPGLKQSLNDDYRIPVEIRIEPERLINQLGGDPNIRAHIDDLINRGLRASLKTGNLVTGALYIDLDFYPKAPPRGKIQEFGGYPIIPTVSGGLAQIQQRLMDALDKINNLPINPLLEQATSTLAQSQKTMQRVQTTLDNLNKITSSQSMQQLPADMQSTLRELNRSMQGFQPGSAAYNKMVADMQRLDQVLRELQPVLKTLNDKSNALVFAVCVLTAFSSGGESKTYYQLPVAKSGAQSAVNQSKNLLWVEQVSIPDYLAGNGVVYQTTDVQYVIANNNLWASPLDQQLRTTLVANLSNQLPGWVVASQPLGSEQDMLNVSVSGFHGRYDGRVIVSGEWLLKHQGQLIKRPFNIEFKQQQDGYDAMVKTLAQAWSQEATAIASELNRLP